VGETHCSWSEGKVAGTKYVYQGWVEDGSGCITVYGADAAFKTSFSGGRDYLARVGLRFDRSRTPEQLGRLSSFLSFTKSVRSGLSTIGIYGATTEPNVEFFIIEDWVGQRPTNLGTKVGTITVDDAPYDVYKDTRNTPTIAIEEFPIARYWSVRQTPRQCGRVSVTEHFLAWKGLGMALGPLYEVSVAAEGYGALGVVDFTVARIELE
jgi:hypothetical protein